MRAVPQIRQLVWATVLAEDLRQGGVPFELGSQSGRGGREKRKKQRRRQSIWRCPRFAPDRRPDLVQGLRGLLKEEDPTVVGHMHRPSRERPKAIAVSPAAAGPPSNSQ